MDKDLALKMLVDVKAELRGVPWWLDFGTLLGAVRNSDFIPWDHDMDIGVWIKDSEKLWHLKNYGFSVYMRDYPHCKACWLKRDGIGLDVKFYYLEGDFAGRAWNQPKRYLRGYFHAGHFLKLVEAQIRGVALPVPSDAACYLSQMWSDWKTPKQKGFDYWGGVLHSKSFAPIPGGMSHA